jgi:hypothetical protein
LVGGPNQLASHSPRVPPRPTPPPRTNSQQSLASTAASYPRTAAAAAAAASSIKRPNRPPPPSPTTSVDWTAVAATTSAKQLIVRTSSVHRSEKAELRRKTELSAPLIVLATRTAAIRYSHALTWQLSSNPSQIAPGRTNSRLGGELKETKAAAARALAAEATLSAALYAGARRRAHWRQLHHVMRRWLEVWWRGRVVDEKHVAADALQHLHSQEMLRQKLALSQREMRAHKLLFDRAVRKRVAAVYALARDVMQGWCAPSPACPRCCRRRRRPHAGVAFALQASAVLSQLRWC